MISFVDSSAPSAIQTLAYQPSNTPRVAAAALVEIARSWCTANTHSRTLKLILNGAALDSGLFSELRSRKIRHTGLEPSSQTLRMGQTPQ